MAGRLKARGWTHVSFADHMKMQGIAENLWTYDEAFITKPPEIRTAMQIRGTEMGWMRYGTKTWVTTLLQGWCNLYAERYNLTRFVISDVRFEHEVAGIEEVGGMVIRLIANTRNEDRMLTAEQAQHSSETALDLYPFRYVVPNDPLDVDSAYDVDNCISHHFWNASHAG